MAREHVHLLAPIPPNLSVSEYVKRVQGRSARKMLDGYEELRRQFGGRHVWVRGYFAASTGNVIDEVIAEYMNYNHGCHLRMQKISV